MRAAPDALRHDAPGVLAHLTTGHTDALVACLRARGTVVGFVHATGVDAGGLTVLVAHGDGVDTIRLGFPKRVASLNELPVSLAAVLKRGPVCSCGRPPRPGGSDSARSVSE